MSYILDALKKAEFERERGAVPGLSSTQTSYSTYISYGGSQKPWWLALLALGVLVSLVLGFWAWRQPVGDAAPAPVAKLAPIAVAPAAPAAPLAPAPTSAPPAPPALVAAQKAEPQVAMAALPKSSAPVAASTVAQVVANAVPAPAAPVTPGPVVLPTTPPETMARVEAAPKALPAGASPVRAAPGALPLLAELPEATRRQIPTLAISGAIYSDSPPEWTLIINDQVMGKGSQVTPDVRLEDISANSAVFNFRGQRFRVDR
jgi:general secretion pathway protein B